MQKNDKDSIKGQSDKSEPQNSTEGNQRRKAIKDTLIIGGLTVGMTKWSTPVVDSVIIPSHAQTSILGLIAIIVIP